MTHEEVRPRLAAYAAGALDRVAAEEVRTHLASGCPTCLRDLFVHPVGLPRDRPEPSAPVAPSSGPPALVPAARGLGLVVAVGVLAVALAAVVGWMVVELRAREAEAMRTERERDEAERARAALEAQVAARDRDLAALRESVGRTAEATRPADDGLRAELDTARARIETLTQTLRGRERELARLAVGAGGGEALREAVEAPDVELLRLGPVAPFRDVRGHVLWHPGAERILVYAYGLPPLKGGARYRVEVDLADGRPLGGPTLPVGAGGQATVPVRVEPSRGSPRAVRVVLEPGGRCVLDWRRVGGS